jgi:hypothetical protein
MVAAAIPIASAGMVLSAMAQAVQSLYGMGGNINDWVDKHIETMKGSENPTISRSGDVLESAKLGFGIGYITPVIIISVGQLLLGNTMAAIGTVATAATLTNPIAMTCAAIGAIYYGWGALSDVERNEILAKLSKGLEIGIELINSIVRFVVETTKGLLNSKNFEEMKKYIGSAASVFGKTLGDVTHKFSDVVSDTFDVVKKKTGEAVTKTGSLADELVAKGGVAIEKTAEVASQTYDSVKDAGGKAADNTLEALENLKSKVVSKKATETDQTAALLTPSPGSDTNNKS